MKKIIITESQYKRLFTEERDFGKLPETINPFIVKLFKHIDKNYTKNWEVLKFLHKEMNFTEHETYLMRHNYELHKGKDYDSLLGEPMEFIGTYRLSTDVPATVYGRGYVNGYIDVRAKSKEDALKKIRDGEFSEDAVDVDDRIDPCNDGYVDFDNMDPVYDMLVDDVYELGDDVIQNIKLKK